MLKRYVAGLALGAVCSLTLQGCGGSSHCKHPECLLEWTKWEADTDGVNAKSVERVAGDAPQCPYKKFSELICPYGKVLIGDVTFPDLKQTVQEFSAKNPNLQLESQQPLQFNAFLVYICLVLGYIPIIVPVLVVLQFLVLRGTRELYFAGYLGFAVLMGEKVWKKSVPLFHFPEEFFHRPPQSCNQTCGMPSSHATVSIGLLSLMLFDLIFRINPLSTRIIQQARGGINFCSLVPVGNSESISSTQFMLLFGFWFCILGFVPWSRTYLGDHTWDQVAIGASIGCVEALIYFCIFRMVARAYQHKLGQTVMGCLTHNFNVPSHEEISLQANGDLNRARELIANEFDAAMLASGETPSNVEMEGAQA